MVTKKEIDHGRAYDWGKVSQDYAKYRDIYPDEFYIRIIEQGLCVKGQNVLDLGTGTGVLPRHLYRYGARFVGADISGNQISEARRLSAEAGMAIDYVVSPAESLDFPDRSFDVVLASQCFFYFDKDIVLPKIHRLLKKDGHLCILYMEWMPDSLGITKKTEELVLKYNPHWTGYGTKRLPPTAPEWTKKFFAADCEIAYDVEIPFTRERWRGRMRACRGIGASSLPNTKIAAFEKELLDFLATVPESFTIPHYITMQSLRRKNI